MPPQPQKQGQYTDADIDQQADQMLNSAPWHHNYGTAADADAADFYHRVIPTKQGAKNVIKGAATAFIIYVAETIGPAILSCDFVINHLLRWFSEPYQQNGKPHQQNISNMEQFGRALADGLRKRAGISTHTPITHWRWFYAKNEVATELDKIRKIINSPDIETVCALVQRNLADFPQLAANWTSFSEFLRDDETINHGDTLKQFCSHRLKGAGVFDRWVAWVETRSTEDFRQLVSNTGKPLRSKRRS